MKKQPKIEISSRQNLGLIAPLKMPFSIEMDVSSYCNLNCQFCFRNSAKNCNRINQCFMNFDLFKKIIDEIRLFDNPVKKLKLSWGGEPLMNEQLPEMISYAKDKGVAECIEIVTNAVALTHELSDKITHAGLDRINISINGIDDEDYKKCTKRNVDTSRLYEEIKYLFENKKKTYLYIKLSNIGYSEDKIQKFYEMYGEFADSIFVESILDDAFEGGIGLEGRHGAYGQILGNKKVCPFLFTRLMINADGRVSLCCMDWACDVSIGDCNKSTVQSIWNSELLRNIQRLHLEKRKDEFPICQKCNAIDAFTVDDIDAYAHDILGRL